MNNRLAYTLIALIFIVPEFLFAQDYYWVAFKDKRGTGYSFDAPAEYLSDRAIQRRIKQGIPIDSLDLPVNTAYISGVLRPGVQLFHRSKWLNGITVRSTIDSFEFKMAELPFVSYVELTKPGSTTKSGRNKFYEPPSGEREPIDTSYYGTSVYQTGIMNGQFLHNQDYRGQGMQIAVLDGGFANANKFPAFDSMWINDQFLGAKDFVNPGSNIFETHYHGMSVLSCMVGNIPGELIGTATKAKYWMIRTEESASEYRIEEDNWIAGAEFADSAGVDIINTSLGYSLFEDPSMNYTYADMDGNTTRVTRGANIAASKGILVIASAGNEGNDPWKYIVAPADGTNVMGIGATNKFGFPAPFTSYGPSYDGRVKPNVSGVGWNTYLQKGDGNIGFSSGTSFSAPVMAGMAACLWQANPNATARQIRSAIEQSAHLYLQPDSLLGYGIPDMKLADSLLKEMVVDPGEPDKLWVAYPNPVSDMLVLERINGSNSEEVSIEVFTLDGKKVAGWVESGNDNLIISNVGRLPSGLLLLRVQSGGQSEIHKLSKITR